METTRVEGSNLGFRILVIRVEGGRLSPMMESQMEQPKNRNGI